MTDAPDDRHFIALNVGLPNETIVWFEGDKATVCKRAAAPRMLVFESSAPAAKIMEPQQAEPD